MKFKKRLQFLNVSVVGQTEERIQIWIDLCATLTVAMVYLSTHAIVLKLTSVLGVLQIFSPPGHVFSPCCQKILYRSHNITNKFINSTFQAFIKFQTRTLHIMNQEVFLNFRIQFYMYHIFIFQYWNGIISAKSKSNAKKECHLFVQNDLNRMSLDALGECVFGYEFNTIEAGDTIISRAFTDLFAGLNPTTKSFSRKLLLWFPFLKCFMKSVIKREEAFKTISCVIKQVRAASIQVNILFCFENNNSFIQTEVRGSLVVRAIIVIVASCYGNNYVTFNYLRDKFSQIVGRLNPSQLRNIIITRIHPILTITK
jgi:hypothetical protein